MANPTLPHDTKKENRDDQYIECEGIIVNGEVVLKAQESTIADAVTSHSIADAGSELAADLETELEGFYDALGVKINAILTALENHGIVADS